MNDFKGIKLPLNLKIVFLLLCLSIITGTLTGLFLASIFWSIGFVWDYWIKISLIGASFVSIFTWIITISILLQDNKKIKTERITHTIIWKEKENSNKLELSAITTATNKELKELAFQIYERKRRLNTSLLTEVFGGRKRSDSFRDEMVRLDFFRWKDINDVKQGLLLTRKGREVLRVYLYSPTPRKDNDEGSR